MTKLSQPDKATMIKHLRELSTLSQKANSKNSKNIQKQIDHTIELTKFMKQDRAKIDSLNDVLAMKQQEIDELNSKQMDLLWDLAKLEKENITMKKEMAEDELRSAQVQKNIKQFIDNESTDN